MCIARDIERWGEKELPAGELMKVSFEEIEKSDIAVLEMSEKGGGLGIKAGYAHARGKPIIVLIGSEHDLSNTLRGIADSIITYKELASLDLARTTLITGMTAER